jgi:hypothetical protein
MFESRELENNFLCLLRWAARAAGIVCLAIIFLFFSSEGINIQQIEAKEWIGLLFFPLGTVIGLIWSWHEEGLGGSITLVSVTGFYLVYGWLLSGNLWLGWALLPFLVPGSLFLLHWFFTSFNSATSHKKTSH